MTNAFNVFLTEIWYLKKNGILYQNDNQGICSRNNKCSTPLMDPGLSVGGANPRFLPHFQINP